MRLKDCLLGSLNALVDAGLVAPFPQRVRPSLPPEDHGAAIPNRLIEKIILEETGHPFYQNDTEWENLVAFIERFKARPHVGDSDCPYSLPRCFGAFRTMQTSDAMAHVAAAFDAAGLRPSTNAVSRRAQFDLSERVKVRDLPAFYGNWLARAHCGYPWDETLALALVARCEVKAIYVAGAALPVPVMNLRLNVPAIHLVRLLHDHLRPVLEATPSSVLLPDRLLINMVARQWHRAPPFLLP